MKFLFSFGSLFFFLLSITFPAQAGNLLLIEKRLTELDKLNKRAVQQAGEIPENGSVEIKAQVLPGKSGHKSFGGVTEGSFNFGTVKILAIDQKLPYTVQISSSQSLSQCFKVATMLRRAGYPAFTASIRLKNQGVWHRIFIGSYATRKDAEKTRLSLEKDEIPDGFIRSMPYTIQIGKAGTTASLKSLKNNLFSMHYLPYSSYVRDTKNTTQQTRLLLGAFATKQDTSILLATLRSQGLQVRVVNR